MSYIDAYLLPVPKDKVDLYKQVAQRAAPLWTEYGATAYTECLADDVPYGELTSFPRAVQVKDDETVVLSWVAYPSKDVRDAANSKMMTDPRMKDMMDTMPVDGARMIFGGFESFVEGGVQGKPFGYVDGFVLSMPPSGVEKYQSMAEMGRELWMQHGAIYYAECRGDDVPYGTLTSFPRGVEGKADDVTFFSFITYKDRASRDAINAKVMADPKMAADMTNAPFDAKRMIFGGFVPFIQQ